jgi:hypothetical protein
VQRLRVDVVNAKFCTDTQFARTSTARCLQRPRLFYASLTLTEELRRMPGRAADIVERTEPVSKKVEAPQKNEKKGTGLADPQDGW